VINAPAQVANRLGYFSLQVAQEILRGIVLGDVELIFGKRPFLIADPASQPLDLGGYGAAKHENDS
jgi:hypothetical protein